MALLPPQFLDAVTAIGVGDDPTDRDWVGTGFLFGLFVDQIDDKSTNYSVFLITNKHVLKNIRKIYLKFNSANDPTSKDYQIELVARNGRPRWVGHPEDSVDVAALPIDANLLKRELRKFAFFRSDTDVKDSSQLQSEGVTEGDGVFVLGFPMGMVAVDRQYAICRLGAISRVRDLYEGNATDYLVDATVFPGNSGGPAIIKPELTSLQGSNPVRHACLIGIVKSYVPYHDIAMSRQTMRARIIFEENSGLTAVEPVEHILATIDLAKKRLSSRIAGARWRARQQRDAN